MIYMTDANGNLIKFANDNQGNGTVYGWQKLDVSISNEIISANFTTVDLSSVIPN